MPGSKVRFFYLEFRPAVVGDMETEREVVISVLVEFVAAVFFVDAVELSVYPVVPDDVVYQLLFKCSSELVDQWGVFRNSGITLRLGSATQ